MFRPEALQRIEVKAGQRCGEIARFIARRSNELAPRRKPTTEGDPNIPPLHESYYAVPEPGTDAWIVASRQPYWHYVEFGTREHGDPQPHVRPAIDEARARFG